MEKKYLDCSIKKYLDDLAAKLPAPGGGSASALVSATGVSCLLMVVNFTIGKKGYEQYEDELKQILSHLSTLNSQLLTLIDEDVKAYSVYSAASKLPKNSGDEIKFRNQSVQSALKNSLAVVCRIFDLSRDAIKHAGRLSEIGNKNLISDVACGLSMLKSGIESSKFNIDINLKCIDDPETKNMQSAKDEETRKAIAAIETIGVKCKA